jgi:hypothetical protein
MRFIKLVKKITILDWLLLGTAVGSLFFLSAYFFKKETWLKVQVKVSPEQWWWEDISPPYWIADAIEEGDAQYNFIGKKEAEVVEGEMFEVGGGRKEIFLWLNLKVDYNEKKNVYRFNHQTVEIGRPLSLSLSGVGIDSIVTWVEGLETERIMVDKVVEVEESGAKVWVAEKINVGDEMRDSQGNLLAEVLDKEVELADMVVTDDRGNVLVRKNPLTRDLTLKLKINTVERFGLFYFLDGQLVKVGNDLWIKFPEVNLDGALITKIIK